MDEQELELLLRTLAAIRETNHKFRMGGDVAALTAHRRELTAYEQARKSGIMRKARKIENVIPDSKYL